MYRHTQDITMLSVSRKTAKLEYFLFPQVSYLDDIFVNRYKATVMTGRDGEARVVMGGDHGGSMDVFARKRGSRDWVHIDLSAETHGLPPHRHWFFYCPTPVSVHRAGTVIIRLRPDSSAGDWRTDLDHETVTLFEPAPQIRHRCEIPWPPVLRDY